MRSEYAVVMMENTHWYTTPFQRVALCNVDIVIESGYENERYGVVGV